MAATNAFPVALVPILNCLDAIEKLIEADKPKSGGNRALWGPARSPDRVAEVAAKVVPKMQRGLAELEKCFFDIRDNLLEVRQRQVAGGFLAKPDMITAFGRKAMFAFDLAYQQIKADVEVAELIGKAAQVAPGNKIILEVVDKFTPLEEWGPVLAQVEAELRHAENVLSPAQPGKGGEGAEVPCQYLTSWREIVIALGMKDNQEDKGKVKTLSTKDPDCPIIIPKQGAQPKVKKVKLLAWWNGLEQKFQEAQQRERNKRATVAAQYSFSRNGTVAPGIAGGVKRPRKPAK
ncbi:MAG: hypothetical protein L6306_17255 [Planctomycetales bacterium]|nr:hypothetical protein [Planctomycetales bacterium]